MTVKPEFSHEIDLGALPAGGKTFKLRPDQNERSLVAARLGVPDITAFEGEMRVKVTSTRIDIKGRVEAALERQCVVSLEPMVEKIDESFEIEFFRQQPDIPVSEDDEDWLNAPDVHEDASIDLGELLVEQLSLAMAPFPRKEEAVSLADQFGSEEEVSPLAAAFEEAEKRQKNQ